MTTTNEVMRMARDLIALGWLYGGDADQSAISQASAALRTAVEALVAERDALKAALEHVTESLDRLGDQSDGEVSPRVWTKYECQARIDAARAVLKGKP